MSRQCVALARAVVKAPKFCHITPILKSLPGLKVNERIEYKLLSLTYVALVPLLNLHNSTQPAQQLHSLISVQPLRATRFSCCHPVSTTFSKITNRSFRYASSHLWNQLPVSFRQPCIKHAADDVTLSNSPPTCSSPLSPSIIHAQNSLFAQIFSTTVC